LEEHKSDRINDVEVAALVGCEHAKTALDVACWNKFGNWARFLSCDLLDGRTDVRISIMSSARLVGPEALREHVAELWVNGYVRHTIKIAEAPTADSVLIAEALADKVIANIPSSMRMETISRLIRVSLRSTLFHMTRACFYSTKAQDTDDLRRAYVVLQTALIVGILADDAARNMDLSIFKAGALSTGRR